VWWRSPSNTSACSTPDDVANPIAQAGVAVSIERRFTGSPTGPGVNDGH
jgi:hypothetical protein